VVSKPGYEVSTIEQFTKIVAFRQAFYNHGLTLTKDVQFELVDALLLNPGIRSFPELNLSPAFRSLLAGLSVTATSEAKRSENRRAVVLVCVALAGGAQYPFSQTTSPALATSSGAVDA
jgi:hypothetical protein